MTFRQGCLLAAILALSCAAAFVIDMPLARAVESGHIPGDLRRLITLAEVFAHGMGVGLILLGIAVLDPAARRSLPRLAASAYGVGLIAIAAKFVLPRIRPAVADLADSVWQTFLIGGGDHYAQLRHLSGWDIQSFPSGHSATAVGLAIGLTWLYPHGRWLFTFYAMLAMAQRIVCQAHYLSDTLAGAAIGVLFATALWGIPQVNRTFAHWEQAGAANQLN